jgi:hypothetical protein
MSFIDPTDIAGRKQASIDKLHRTFDQIISKVG